MREWQLVMHRDNHIDLFQRKFFNKVIFKSRKFIFIGLGIVVLVTLLMVKYDQFGHSTAPISNKSKLLSMSATLPAQSVDNSSLNVSSSSAPQTNNNAAVVDQSVSGNNVQSSETINIATTTSTRTSPNELSTTNNVVINGKNVQVPANTDYSKTLVSPNGVTSLNVSNQANQSGTSSSMSMQIDTQSVNNNTTSESE